MAVVVVVVPVSCLPSQLGEMVFLYLALYVMPVYTTPLLYLLLTSGITF